MLALFFYSVGRFPPVKGMETVEGCANWERISVSLQAFPKGLPAFLTSAQCLYGEKPGKNHIRRRENAHVWILAGGVDFDITLAPMQCLGTDLPL